MESPVALQENVSGKIASIKADSMGGTLLTIPRNVWQGKHGAILTEVPTGGGISG